MSPTALHANHPSLMSSWHSSVADFPASRRYATPFHTPEWAAAWQSVHTERVRGHSHLLIQDGPRTHRMSFYKIHNSPMWRAIEAAAGVAESTFDGDVLYGPSLYAEYGGLPYASVPVLAEAAYRARALARDLGSEALVVANIPPAELKLWRKARPTDAEVVLH
jgi:hypothetical protein